MQEYENARFDHTVAQDRHASANGSALSFRSITISIVAAVSLLFWSASDRPAQSAADEVLTLSQYVVRGFERYMKSPKAMFFAVSEDGRSFGWSYCQDFDSCRIQDGRRSALRVCERNSENGRCKIYASRKKVVWIGPVKIEKSPPTPTSSDSVASRGGVPIDWLDAKGRKFYSGFETKPLHRAFVVSEDRAYGATWNAPTLKRAIERAFSTCENKNLGSDCRLYELNDMKLSGVTRTQALSQLGGLKRQFAKKVLATMRHGADAEQSVGDKPTKLDGKWNGKLELTRGGSSCFDKRELSVLIENGAVVYSSSVVGREIVGFAVSESGTFRGVAIGRGQRAEFFGTVTGDRAIGQYEHDIPACEGEFTLLRD